MKTARVKFKKGEDSAPYMDGEFEFKMSKHTVLDEDIPKRDITFSWCLEVPQLPNAMRYEELYEMIAEKLKQDFLKFLHSNG